MPQIDLILEKLGFLRQSNSMPLDQSDAFLSRKPGIAIGLYCNGTYVIIRQPAQALPILPGLAIESNGAFRSCQPDHAVFGRDDGSNFVIRQSVGRRVRRN